MQIKAKINGMSIEKNVKNLSEFADYVVEDMGFNLWDIEKVQRKDV